MTKRISGTYVSSIAGGEKVRAFVPKALPPSRPALNLNEEINETLFSALGSLKTLNLASKMVPDTNWFIYGFVRKEAVLSSQIEGTQASLFDLFESEDVAESGELTEDVEEVCNYVHAIDFGLKQLRSKGGLPLSLRLIRELHKQLMKGVRGEHKSPGQFRKSQNWIGGTRPGNAKFVPPPHERMPKCLEQLEKYLHSKSKLPALVRVGLIHAQFETIHPFLDGNGRVGRLLIALIMNDWKLLDSPLLYLSLYFKRHQQEYYSRLNGIRTEGDWESWIQFFLEGVDTVSTEATQLAQDLYAITRNHNAEVLAYRKSTLAAVRLLELLPANPIISLPRAVSLLKTTKPTAVKTISLLEELGILKEITGKKRDRKYSYATYLSALGAE